MQTSKLVQLAALLIITAGNVLAQGTPQQPAPSPSASPAQTTTTEPTVTAVKEVKPRVISMVGSLELDDIIEVDLENLEKWAETNDASKLVPYINGRAIKGTYPEEIHLARGRLIYHLEITPDNKGVWTDLLGAPTAIRHPVTLSVGLENGSAFDSVHVKGNPVILTVISPVYGLIALLVIAVTLVLLLWLARKTNIIREPGPVPAPGKRRPYNLGRTQMAFWFFLIYSSYMAIWLITDALDTITPSLLALMGISAGTALGEALIDNGKDTARTNQVQDLTAERQAVEQSISQSQSDLDANVVASATVADQSNRDVLNRQLTDSRTRLGQINQQLRTLDSQQAPLSSSGFLRDILSDGSGYSFHRFQIFAWTIVLGIIFVSSVYNNLTMPEFSPTLLGLMGLSAGTYIGFKFPEQK
ncbi:MAG TPA: hypothetical protein VHS05_18405 [Pyrinomonadaceae bacterium]|jgi:hypothetical protein|nr:hypothetical protein [Pyrinomonadaceae bacterium]